MLPVHTRKAKERHNLADHVLAEGVEMPPCSNCECHNTACIVSEGSSHCGECIHCSVKCDSIHPSDWDALKHEEACLDHEWLLAIQIASENLACAQCLETQHASLHKHGGEMLCEGLKSIDELDAAEEWERQEQETQRQAMLGLPQHATAPNASLLLTTEELAVLEHPDLWPWNDTGKGTHSASQGNWDSSKAPMNCVHPPNSTTSQGIQPCHCWLVNPVFP